MKRLLSLILATILPCSMLMMQVGAYDTGVADGTNHRICANDDLSAMIDADGGLWIWGGFSNAWHNKNQLPQKILDNVAAINTRFSALAAIKTDGSLWIWEGDNYKALLENRKSQNSASVAPEKIMDNVVSVSMGFSHYGAVQKDGSLWMWGSNYDGKLGVEGYSDLSTPIKVMDNVSTVSVGYSYTLALKNDHTLWSWGENKQGQLGNGTTRENGTFALPSKIMDDVAAISAGCSHAAAIKEDGSLWMWGSNSLGELGNGGIGNGAIPYGGTHGSIYADIDAVFQTSPVKIMDNVVAVNAGENVTAAVKSDGSLWMWGINENDQLGNDSSNTSSPDTTTSDGYVLMNGLTWQNTPIKVLDHVVTANTGRDYTLAIRTDGTVWGWGSNYNGQLRLDAVKDNSVSGETMPYISGPVAIKGLPNTVKSSHQTQSQAIVATPTASKVFVNGKETLFDAYTINQNNYFKLRDIASVLSGTNKQFEVTWNSEKGAIEMLSNQAYTSVGGELAAGDGSSKTPVLNTAKVYLDGKEVSLTAYTINGNNYFKLRDLGQLFNFGVSWNGAVVVDTSTGYVDDTNNSKPSVEGTTRTEEELEASRELDRAWAEKIGGTTDPAAPGGIGAPPDWHY